MGFTKSYQSVVVQENGGAMRDRTADLLRARQALSQLSYSPEFVFRPSLIFRSL